MSAGETVAAASPARLPMLRALTLPDFRLLWFGQSISLIGDQFYYIALAWLTLQLSGSALALAGVLVTGAIPRGALMLFGGAVSDRWSPRALMLASDLTRGVLVGVQAVLVLAGAAQMWELYVLAGVFGTVDALFYPSSGALVPMIVDEERRPSAAALGQITQQGATFAGPLAAGLLIATVGAVHGSGVAFAVDAGSFVLSAVALFFMRGGTRLQTDAEGDRADGGILGSVLAGLRYAWHDPVLRALLFIIAGIDLTLNGLFGVGLPLLARTHLSGGAAALGSMDSAFGVGALIGILLAGMVAVPRRRGLLIAGVTITFGIAAILMPLMPGLPGVLAVILVAAVGSGAVNVLLMPWLQDRTDPSMFGRVSSIVMFASLGLTPLAYALAGWVAAANLSLLFTGGGLLILVTAVLALSSREVRSID